MSSRSVAVIATAGLALTSVLAWWSEMSIHHAALMAVVAAGGAAVAGVIGAGLMLAFRNRSFGSQATVATITPVAAIAVGAVLAAQASAMYLNPDDLPTLGVVIVAALTVALLVCVVLARRVSSATQTLEAAARRIGAGDLTTPVDEPSTREFALLARELDSMSRRLDEARARERQLDASRRELVAWVSHDLRTPLAGIRAMAEALEDGVAGDPETVERYHRAMRVETERLAHLVDELFELSVINAGAVRATSEPVSLGDLVSDALAGAAAAADARGVKVQGRLSGTISEVELVPAELGRVLSNLLENAVRETPSGGSVGVEAGVDGGSAYVSVTDECGGIPEPDISRVFDLAFRGQAARTPNEGGGAGLGLAIARGIAEVYGGDITVRNHGRGCRFTVRIPSRSAAAAGDGDGQVDDHHLALSATNSGSVGNGSRAAGKRTDGDDDRKPAPSSTALAG